MTRPEPPKLHGKFRDPRNRFEWDADQNPSPQRAKGGETFRQANESLPVLCEWCGQPFWPEWFVTEGCCMEACEQAFSAWQQEREERRRLLAELQMEEITTEQLRNFLGKGSVV
jgi:hypothetical protein